MNHKRIPVWKKGEIIDWALVDEEDFQGLSKFHWFLDAQGYVRTKFNYKDVKLHHAVLWRPKGVITDHINRDRLDNRKSNLRFCSTAQNAANKRGNASSGFKGVYLCVGRTGIKRWRATITKNGQAIALGMFSSKEAAAKAYDKAALRLFGSFAKTNYA